MAGNGNFQDVDWSKLPAPEDDGAARHLEGARLPRIPLPATDGTSIDLSKLEGRWVVFVYPWTGTPGRPNPPNWDDIPGAHGSTPEVEGFRDAYASYREMEVNLLGVSGQTAEEQKAFSDRLGLPFVLASDADGGLRDALELPSFETGGVTYLKRLTFVLRDGKIERIVYPVHPPPTHAGELLETLKGGA